MPSSNFDEKCKQIALQCGIRVDCSADERGALKLRGPKAQLLSALKSINEVLTSQIEKVKLSHTCSFELYTCKCKIVQFH